MPRKSKQLGKPYTGELKTPIKIPSPPVKRTILGGAATDEEREIEYQKEVAEYNKKNMAFISCEAIKKLQLLKTHYDIDGDDRDAWYQVATDLAMNHVPGFAVEVEGSVGRKTKWNFILHAKLYFDVLKHTGESFDKSLIETACYKLIEQEPWCSMLIGKGYMPPSAKVLQNHFAQARKSPLVSMYEFLPDDANTKAAFRKNVEDVFDEFLDKFPVK